MVYGLFGYEVTPKVFLIAVVGFVLLLLASKFGLLGGNVRNNRGEGRMYQCQRCGTNFQAMRIEETGDGAVNRYTNDRCPNCGWDKDNPDPDDMR